MYLQQGAGTLERKHAYTCGRYRNRIRTGEVCTTHYIRKSVLKELVLGELDHLFRKLYEDNALGRLSDQQFTFMVSGYDDEKAALVEKIRGLEKEVSTVTERRDDVGRFVQIVRTICTDITAEKVSPAASRIPTADSPILPPSGSQHRCTIWANFRGNMVTNSRNRHTRMPARLPGLQIRFQIGNTKKNSSTSSGSRSR